MQAEKSILLVNIYGFSVGIQGVSRLITFKERAYIINNKHANSITHAKFWNKQIVPRSVVAVLVFSKLMWALAYYFIFETLLIAQEAYSRNRQAVNQLQYQRFKDERKNHDF